MFKLACFTLVCFLTTFAMANRTEKLKKEIAEKEVQKEVKREIAREKALKEPKKKQ